MPLLITTWYAFTEIIAQFQRLMNIGMHFWQDMYEKHGYLVERPAAEIGVLLTDSGSALSLSRVSILERCVFHQII